jgi:hypothetical protein
MPHQQSMHQVNTLSSLTVSYLFHPLKQANEQSPLLQVVSTSADSKLSLRPSQSPTSDPNNLPTLSLPLPSLSISQ